MREGLHSTEIAFVLHTQRPWVRITAPEHFCDVPELIDFMSYLLFHLQTYKRCTLLVYQLKPCPSNELSDLRCCFLIWPQRWDLRSKVGFRDPSEQKPRCRQSHPRQRDSNLQRSRLTGADADVRLQSLPCRQVKHFSWFNPSLIELEFLTLSA